ncbi:MAG: sialidase family protein, partial [Flavobacteriales bacterium]
MIWNGSGTSGTNVNGQNGPIFYSRSNDGGLTWPILRTVIPAINSTSYRGWDADAYAIDAKNGVVVIVYGDFDTDVGIIKSTDGGTTWTKKIVQQFPIPLFDANTMSTDAYGPNGTGAPDGIADTLLSNGADAHALIDNSGMVHVWFSKIRVYSRTAGLGLSYFPNSDGLYYWNETKPVNGYVLVAQTLDMNNNGVVNLPSGGACSSPYGYYDGGLTQMPSAGIDASGNLYVTYQSICELCDTTTATLAGYQAR